MYPLGGSKLTFLLIELNRQQVGLVFGFLWVLVLWTSQIYVRNIENTLNQKTCVFV